MLSQQKLHGVLRRILNAQPLSATAAALFCARHTVTLHINAFTAIIITGKTGRVNAAQRLKQFFFPFDHFVRAVNVILQVLDVGRALDEVSFRIQFF